MESNDARRSREGAEHDHDATVFLEVRNRLDTAASLVEKGNGAWSRDEELLPVALGRAVEQPVTGEWRGGDEEHRLVAEPGR